MPLKPATAASKDATTGAAFPAMAHRHFAAIAATVASMSFAAFGDDYTRRTLRYSVAASFADRLASTNPRFDRARFMAACGVVD